mmetsp:Transcript_12825/g.29528  ORF Transcript_12825/g.29528 Transcript_12825/m.29528 type:complete len:104 (-) Transcript_12825:618-929(-)
MDRKAWFVPSGTKSASFKKWWPREALAATLKMQAEEARKNAPAKVTHLTEEKAESAVKDRRQQEAYSEEYPQASEEFLRFWGLNTTVSFPSSEVKILDCNGRS